MKKLRVINNWENYEWYAGEELINTLEKVSINGNTYKVKPKTITNQVYDMGHRYTVNTITFVIHIAFEGIKIPIDIYNLLNKGLDIRVIK